MELKTTPSGNSYWTGNGVYQEELKILTKKLVPEIGQASTVNGELLRIVNNFSYEYNNNGNVNAKNCTTETEEYRCVYCNGSGHDEDKLECNNCDGEGVTTEEYYTYVLTNAYSKHIELIRDTIKTPEMFEALNQLTFLILNSVGNNTYFSDENQAKYSFVFDRVIHYCLTHEDKELPYNYHVDYDAV